MIDIGTGDGRFVYQCARQNRQAFYIGIDANAGPLEAISRKAHRKPAKGGVPNALFIQATAEALPPELDGLADEVHVHFPWGSLLRAVATGDEAMLRGLRRICTPGALLEVVIGLDVERDQSEIKAHGRKTLMDEDLERILVPRYKTSGFEVLEHGALAPSEWPELRISWAKRLRIGKGRSLFYLVARAKGSVHP